MLAELGWTLTDGTSSHSGSNETGSTCSVLELNSGDTLVGNIHVSSWITTPGTDPTGEAHEMISGISLQVRRANTGMVESWASGLGNSSQSYAFSVDGMVLVGLFGAFASDIASWGAGFVHLGFFVRGQQAPTPTEAAKNSFITI